MQQKQVLVDWPLLLRVMRIWQIWFLACTEAIKGELQLFSTHKAGVTGLHAEADRQYQPHSGSSCTCMCLVGCPRHCCTLLTCRLTMATRHPAQPTCLSLPAGMSVMALMLWLPVMVNSLISGGDPTQLQALTAAHAVPHPPTAAHAGGSSGSSSPGSGNSTGTLAVLLTAIPFTCAAVLTTALGALAQRTGHPLCYNFVPNLIGGVAFLAFPWVVHANRVAGFIALSVALASGYASSPHPMAALSRITAQVLAKQRAESPMGTSRGQAGDAQGIALALPMYNTVAMTGGFFGPWLLGVAIERLGGFSAGAVAMGVCMLAAGVAVLLLWCLHAPTAAAGAKQTSDTAAAAAAAAAADSSHHGSESSTELAQQQQARREGSFAASLVGSLRTSEGGTMGRGLRGSLRRKVKDDDGDGEGSEQEQLLHVAAGGEDVAAGVSSDVDVLACREGSSPRIRPQRGRGGNQ